MSTETTNDPIVIGFEQVQEAARVLGITDLETVHEIQMTPRSVRVVRVVRDKHGAAQYEPNSFELETVASTIAVIVDEDTKAALAEQDRPKPRLNHMSSDVYLDSIEYEDSALDEMEAQQ